MNNMGYNNLKIDYNGEILEETVKLNYTIFEVYIINKYHNYLVSDENISKLFGIHLEDIQKVVNNYDPYLKGFCNQWSDEIKFFAGAYAPFNNLIYLNNGYIQDNKINLNLSFENIISILKKYFKDNATGEISSAFLISPENIERLVFRYISGDFDDIEIQFLKKNKLIDELINLGKEINDKPKLIEIPTEEYVDKIHTTVKVGKSYNNKGWTISRKDISLLIPLLSYEKECDVIVDGIPSKGRLSITTRIFFSKNNVDLINYLERLASINPDDRANLDILLNHTNPFSNSNSENDSVVYNKENDSKNYDKKIIVKVKVGKAFSSNGWTVPRNTVSSMVPLLSYEEDCDIVVDDIPSKARLNIAPRIFYKGNNKLKGYLKDLYDKNPETIVKIEILLNHS